MWTWKPEGLEYFIWILPPNAVGHDLVLQETAQPHSPIACGPRGSGRANREQAHCVLVAPNQERSSYLPCNTTISQPIWLHHKPENVHRLFIALSDMRPPDRICSRSMPTDHGSAVEFVKAAAAAIRTQMNIATRLTGSELQLRVRIRVVSACKTYNSRSRTARQNRALSTSLVLSNWEVMRCILHLST